MKREVFRPATLAEREKYYKKEFSLKKIKRWFKVNKIEFPQLCAIDAGTETGIIKDKKLKGEMLYFPFSKLEEKIRKYVPEDVYYDRNKYKNTKKALNNLEKKKFIMQELVFDIDCNNIKCNCEKKEKFCEKCLRKIYSWALKLDKELRKIFKKTIIVYSGRGFHIHVFDKIAFLMNKKERKDLVKKFKNFPIDHWVSEGYIELIRLPYSLNGLVSRKVIPLESNKFKIKETIPKFIMD